MSGSARPAASAMPPIDDVDIPVRHNATDRDDEDDNVAPAVMPAVMPAPITPPPRPPASTLGTSNLPPPPPPPGAPTNNLPPPPGGTNSFPPPPPPPLSPSPYNSMPMGSSSQPGMTNSNFDANNYYNNIANNSESRDEEHWVKAYWRPAAAWLYMVICFMDFVGFPALAMLLPAILKGFGITIGYTAWQSLTLSNGGLIHVAFGTILGISAWSRGKEKLADKH